MDSLVYDRSLIYLHSNCNTRSPLTPFHATTGNTGLIINLFQELECGKPKHLIKVVSIGFFLENGLYIVHKGK